jgi:predicted nucleic acid-binding protein
MVMGARLSQRRNVKVAVPSVGGATVSRPCSSELLSRFLAVPISLRSPQRVYRRVLELADQYDLPAVYDAYYVALAELLGATF